ncbi:MAG: hypothetical protein UT84_C0004G0024 [Candidatus Curtissbacteria bacterium GW2011_GWA1_40_16]|uniref:YdbS-like PH domain-containing protein n=1 Tax=Candidatus Curtissbacteria bacterium GW2011_GWA1_40_16 TaxID=1618405 RepID=A0A0G0RM32_9BACT|nr:MAG: hypothetical protein UT84_C0004G0024 [Candidatus Curtissbacteria bacterium GW2011_GWA1_40_16]
MDHKPPPKGKKKQLQKLLGSGEEVVYITSIGTRYFWINFITILPMAFLLIGMPKLSKLIRQRQSFTYALTNRRFMIIRGIFSRKIVTAPLTAITHVTIEQSFFQRFIFNTGHLVIITAGFDQREIVIENIGNPVEFKIMIEELTRKIEDSWEPEDDKKDNFKLRPLSA